LQPIVRPALTVEALQREARLFAKRESTHRESSIYGIDNGKKIGDYLERKLSDYLEARYTFARGNPASGIDFPDLQVDVKVTSAKQPQSSAPYKLPRQKVFGLGYSLLVFVYNKTNDPGSGTSTLNILHVLFIEAARTADYGTTKGILDILQRHGSLQAIIAYLHKCRLPIDDVEAKALAEEILLKSPVQGYLGVSLAPQWRLGYSRPIKEAGQVDGIVRVGGTA
jgi:hypothetical protein